MSSVPSGDESHLIRPSSARDSSESSGEIDNPLAGRRTVGNTSDDSTPELKAHVAKPPVRKEKRRPSPNRMSEIRADLRFMLEANHQPGGQRVYSGFRLVRTRDVLKPDEEQYVDAFIPLDVAQVYPELLAFEGLNYEDVYCNEILSAETRVVVRPGRFKILRRSWVAHHTLSRGRLWKLAALLAAAAGLVLWLQR